MPQHHRFTAPWVVVAGCAALLLTAGTGGAVAGGMITSAKIKDETVLSRDVRNGTLNLKDLDRKTRNTIKSGTSGPRGEKGERGDKGDPGEQGEAGKDGLDGISGYELVSTSATALPAMSSLTSSATCPEGKVALGGGYDVPLGAVATVLAAGRPTANGYTAKVANTALAATTVSVYAVCALVD